MGIGKKEEPALNAGANVAFIAAIWALVNGLWPNLISLEIQNAITQIALILIPVVIGFVIRSKVWPSSSVEELQKLLSFLESENKTLSKVAARLQETAKNERNLP